jgi:hypothetical protein
MTTHTLRDVVDAARKLTTDEQAELVDLQLTGSEPDAEWDRLWGAEAERRLAEIERGDVETVDANVALAAGRGRLAVLRAGK